MTNREILVVGIAIILALIAAISSLTSKLSAPLANDWSVEDNLDGDNMFRFVTIKNGLEKDRQVYNNAIEALCGHTSSPRICVLNFFMPGDVIPINQTKTQFFALGGFKNYPMLATYWRNRNTGMAEFTYWNCERAGIAGSPASALCDPMVKAIHSAALDLGNRTSNILGCGWPQTNDAAHFASFLLTVSDTEKRELYRGAFDTMNSGKGPDDRANCIKLRARSEESARAARQTLGIPQPTNSQPTVQPAPIPRRTTKP